MQARSKLKPGQKGTRKLVELYGSRLICVCYRYDEARQRRVKTVELIVEEIDWTPKPKQPRPETVVQVRVVYGEAELGRKVRAAGGKPKGSNTTNPSAQERLAKASNTRNPKASSI